MTRIVISTDSQHIADLAQKNHIDVPYLRPVELAEDQTLMYPVVEHLLRFLEEQEQYKPDIIVLLQPTSPFRKSHHIDEVVGILKSTDADSVVSVVEVPHNFNPLSVMQIVDNMLMPYIKGQGTKVLRRQDKPKVYARNGAAIYAVRCKSLFAHENFFGDVCHPYVMQEEDSIDIDTLYDLEIAECLMSKRVIENDAEG